MNAKATIQQLSSFVLVTSLVSMSGCGPVPPDSTVTLERLNVALAADSLRPAVLGDSCMRIHELWRDQLRVALDAVKRPRGERKEAFLEAVYRPHETFWQGYVGGERGFLARVVSRWKDLETDPRAAVPLEIDVPGLLVETRHKAEQLAQRPAACTTWYLVYGPGWVNLGGGPMGMLVDFFGLPADHEAEDLRIYMPHEMGHLIFSRTRGNDPDTSTLLHSITEEGFVSYFSVLYAAGSLSSAESLGYTEEEWAWAKQHEAELWALALPKLGSRDREVIDPFRAAGKHVMPGAPGKIGYFLGYRIIEEYVARHGPESWRQVYDLPLAAILAQSGFGT